MDSEWVINMSTKLFGVMLPSGNADQLDAIELNLHRLQVSFTKDELKTGGALFSFSETELSKLPKDKYGSYVPLKAGEGYSIYPIAKQLYQPYMKVKKNEH